MRDEEREFQPSAFILHPFMVVYYLHGDHLGSVSLTTDTEGAVVSEGRYLPYGEERWVEGATPTDFGFTSQRAEGFGLMDYNARYYSPALGRFVSPDSMVPEPTSSSGFNRYAYVKNNPLRYTDPSGYFQCEGAVGCEEPPTPPPPGEDPAWDRATSYDPNLPYGAFLDGRAQYERYIANPDLYAGDWTTSSELASYRTDIASIYADYGLGECLGCKIEGRLEGGLAESLYSQGDPLDMLGATGGGGVAAGIIGGKG
ncbi:MAG: RHS repeat-associated core domain-containing protein, partial [Chloroflexota bacterium]